MVVEILVATAHRVDALCQEISQTVRDARRIARIAQHASSRATQPNALVHTLEQQHAAVRTDVATLEVGLDHAPTKASEPDRLIGTLWHRQSSVVIGLRYL